MLGLDQYTVHQHSAHVSGRSFRGILLDIQHDGVSLVKASLQEGVPLTIQALQDLIRELKLELPQRAKQSVLRQVVCDAVFADDHNAAYNAAVVAPDLAKQRLEGVVDDTLMQVIRELGDHFPDFSGEVDHLKKAYQQKERAELLRRASAARRPRRTKLSSTRARRRVIPIAVTPRPRELGKFARAYALLLRRKQKAAAAPLASTLGLVAKARARAPVGRPAPAPVVLALGGGQAPAGRAAAPPHRPARHVREPLRWGIRRRY